MKIIAHTSSGYLVESSVEELDKISGKNNYNINSRSHTTLTIGTIIDISPAYHQLHAFSKVLKSFSALANTLKATAETLEKAPVITVLSPEEALKLKV